MLSAHVDDLWCLAKRLPLIEQKELLLRTLEWFNGLTFTFEDGHTLATPYQFYVDDLRKDIARQCGN